MKKVFFIFVSLLFFVGYANAQSSFGNIKIMLTVTDGNRNINEPDDDTDPETAPKTRSIIFQPAHAYLYNNKVVTVDFQITLSAVTVNVVNNVTGETVYSEALVNPRSISIDLNGANSGDYRLEIISDGIALEGYFPL